MFETADHEHHLAEDLGEPGQPEGAGARRGRRGQVLPHAQVAGLFYQLDANLFFCLFSVKMKLFHF